MRRRFALFESGQMRILVQHWLHDRARAMQHAPRHLDTATTVKLAVKLIEEGLLSKGLAHLSSKGLGDMEREPIIAQLRDKHPQARRNWARHADDAPRLALGGARDVLKNLRRRAGTGAGRFRNDYLIRHVRREMNAASQAHVLSEWEVFTDHAVNGDFPDWWYVVWTTIVLFAPIKKRGQCEDTHDCRPVGCGSVRRRAHAQNVKEVIKDDARETCEPVQLGQGTPAGTQCMGMKLVGHMKANPDHCLFKNDADNAFNSVERSEMMAEIAAETSKLKSATRYFESELRPRSDVYALKGGRLKKLDF